MALFTRLTEDGSTEDGTTEKENVETYELYDGSSGESMNFLDGILAVAGIGGGKDTYTSTVSGSTTVLAIALTVILGLLIYAGFGGFSVRKSR